MNQDIASKFLLLERKRVMIQKRLTQNGFSLLELLIAISLLTIGLLAVTSMQGVAINSNSLANRLSVAASLSQEIAEELLSREMTDPLLNTASINAVYDLDPNSEANSISIPGAGTYAATFSITPNALINGTSLVGTSRIDITVNYMTENGTARAVIYTTYKRVI